MQGKKLTWKVKVDGSVARVIVQDAGQVNRYAVRERAGTGTHKIVVLKNGTKVEVFKIKT